MAYVFSTLSLRDSDGDTGPFCWWTFRYPPWAFVDRGARKRMFPVTRDVVDRQRKKTCGAADRCSRLHFGFPTLKAYYNIMSRWAHQFAGNPCGCGGGPTVHHQHFLVYSYPSRRPYVADRIFAMRVQYVRFAIGMLVPCICHVLGMLVQGDLHCKCIHHVCGWPCVGDVFELPVPPLLYH